VLLELKNIIKTYQSPSGNETRTVLNNLSLNIDHGDSLAIVGPSGSGKSTLLNIIGTLDRPSSGEVLLDGQNLSGLSDNELAGIRSQKIGFIFQLHHLLPQCTVLENVLIPTLAKMSDANGEQSEKRAIQLLERVELGSLMEHRPTQLSGGEQQRVAVIRALINQPQLILADEPTGSLDQVSAANLGKLLVELNREEKLSLITVTHSAQLAALMNQVYSLSEGHLVEQDGK
jgi:ABC-type lipoprotein export system ATPase subunit